MNEARRFANVFGEVGSKRDYIVVSSFLNLVDSFNRELRPRFDLLERVTRNSPQLGMHFADSNLHVEPLLEFALLAPERAHFR